MKSTHDIPRALLITPPVYDFAYYDLYAKSYGLLRIGRWLAEVGYDVVHINAMSADDPASIARLGHPKRKANGTGKSFRIQTEWPGGASPVFRGYARYGIVPESMEKRIQKALAGDGFRSNASGSGGADIVLIGTGMTYWYPGVREVVDTVRRYSRRVPIVAGGIYATLLPDHCRNVCGVTHVVEGDAWPGLSGILSTLGLPAPTTAPEDRVMIEDASWSESALLRINTGCPYRCDYCASSLIHPSFVGGSGDAAFEAACEIADRHGTRHFAFLDDALLHRPVGAFDRFLERVIESEREFRFYLPNAIHLSYLNAERAAAMKRAGFVDVRFGFESASEVFHTSHGVKYARGSTVEAMEALAAAGYSADAVTLYVLAGMPGQEYEEAERSVRVGASLGARVEIAEFSPVPGTVLWEQCVRESIFPIETEPLYQNNTILPMRSSRFDVDAMQRLKAFARSGNASHRGSGSGSSLRNESA